MFRLSAATFCCALFISIFSPSLRAQAQSTDDTIRVTVAIGADGSRTTYESDRANHKATATTSGPDGKLRQKIQFELDEAGHYTSSQAFGPEGQFRFKALYKGSIYLTHILKSPDSGHGGTHGNSAVESAD
jgi:hypothetical protein